MRRPGRYGVVASVLVSALVLAGCDGEDEATEPTETETGEAEEPAEPGVQPDGETRDEAGEEADPAAEPEEVDEDPPRVDVPGAEAMELTTPGTVPGAWPVLAWEPADGAASYEVTLYAASGQAYWSWNGETTEVRVGGFSEEPAEDSSIGPRVHEPMTWDVVARDADGEIVAQSGERPIAPPP